MKNFNLAIIIYFSIQYKYNFMTTPVHPEPTLLELLEAECWTHKMYTIGSDTPNPDILPAEVRAICDDIISARLSLPIEQLLDMSEFDEYPDRYPQRYVIGYFGLMNIAIDYIQGFYNPTN